MIVLRIGIGYLQHVRDIRDNLFFRDDIITTISNNEPIRDKVPVPALIEEIKGEEIALTALFSPEK